MRPEDIPVAASIVKKVAANKANREAMDSDRSPAQKGGVRIASSLYVECPAAAVSQVRAVIRRALDAENADLRRRAARIGLNLPLDSAK